MKKQGTSSPHEGEERQKTICPHIYMEQVIPIRGSLEEEHGYRGSTARAWSRCSRCHKSLNAILREREREATQ